ncbi:MAG: APC family permease [Melioribacter sp.]|uniref:APC family permease n=1 Tax=Rosettibacter primus TaxID=3111523 RepID=UPI00247C43A8|nr:APC family permease [Melioribacter sp.]
MNMFISLLMNFILIATFIYLIRKKNLLSFFEGGKWWLTWLAVGIITLMDELTSIYYAPFEAFRFIGMKAIVYIALTSLLIRFLSTRMVEISEILEKHGMRGGGVFSFSYLSLGPTVSFVAISSILVDYTLTATISTVSAVENGTTFLGFGYEVKYIIMFFVVWFIAAINILGIRENAKFTFGIFIFAAFVLINLLLGGLFNFDNTSLETLRNGLKQFTGDFTSGSIFHSYSNLIIGVGSCILAYSGIESVLQTASLVKSWHDIRKAYLFLAFTVGIVTPLIALFALTSKVPVLKHETDLIPTFASITNGHFFGVVVSIMASVTLIMAVNTAMVASAELIEKIAEKYNYAWLIKLNKRQALYRIHIINAAFYTLILIVTSGSQAILAEMYAVGLVASFCINTGSLLKYRYSYGRKEITAHTSRLGTLILFIILLSTFIYIVVHRPYGTLLWLVISTFVLLAGIKISKTRAPEIPRRRLSDSPMDIVFRIAEIPEEIVHIYFKRPQEDNNVNTSRNELSIFFYSPRTEKPENKYTSNYWISLQDRTSLIDMIYGLLETIYYELHNEKQIHIHFGWPMSSWLDRISIGIMTYKLTRLPKKFPDFHFHLEYKPIK